MTDREAQSPIIRLSHVHHAYGSQKALSDLNIEIFKNEWVFISGPSGAGKSTLLSLLHGGARPSQGQIQVDGIQLERLPARHLPLVRRKLGIIFQDYKLIPGRSVYDNIALVLEASGQRRDFITRKVRNVLRLVGMEPHAHTLPPRLSGGEQQRVAVARAVVADPKIILADEPTGNLDEASARAVMELLRAAFIRGATLVIATHDQQFIQRLGGRVLQLNQGRLVATSAGVL
ncbi:MAG: cell division ATP-binding protein FtsE [Hyphomicrobiales bacterium]